MIKPNIQDLSLLLYSNHPVIVDKVPIYPIPISTIAAKGYVDYNKFLRLFCIDAKDVFKDLKEDVDNESLFTVLIVVLLQSEYVCNNCNHSFTPKSLEQNDFFKCPKCNSLNTSNSLLDLIQDWLSTVCKNSVVFSYESVSFLIKSEDSVVGEINAANYTVVRDIIKLRNGMTSERELDENPANEKARELLERKKRLAAKKERNRKSTEFESDNTLNLGDLVSILASGLKLPLQTVMEYDMFQFNDQFNRLKIFDDYSVNIQALLHGADSNKISLKHWISKINTDED